MKTKIFLDTEFILYERDGQRDVDLVSIGMVDDDGRTFYGQVATAPFYHASPWVQTHVLEKLTPCPNTPNIKLAQQPDYHTAGPGMVGSMGKRASCGAGCPWFSPIELRDAIRNWVDRTAHPPEFWGYFVAYDWYLLTRLFGSFIELPPGWPQHAFDIVQYAHQLQRAIEFSENSGTHNALNDAHMTRAAYVALAAHEQRVKNGRRKV